MKPSVLPPTIALVIGALLATIGVKAQYSPQLRVPLATAVPSAFEGFNGTTQTLPEDQLQVLGVTNYLSEVFQHPDTTITGPRWFSLYVGYYERQTSGKTIHSPKNCLPGSGWEPLQSTTALVATPEGNVRVNRYLIQNGKNQALVLYWYQGRGRVAFNEYRVKWDLVRDAALRRRSEEALVRIVVPVRSTEAVAFALAERVARQVIPRIDTALPAG